MREHVEYCGARTESCEVCRKLVMLKYQQMHEDSGHRKTKPDEGQLQYFLFALNFLCVQQNERLTWTVSVDEMDEEQDDDGLYANGQANARNAYPERNPYCEYSMNNAYLQADVIGLGL